MQDDDVSAPPLSAADGLRLASLPLDVGKILALLDWHPAIEPGWALTLSTSPATAGTMERMLDARMDADGASLAQRLLAPFALGLSRDTMRKQVCTRSLLEAAYSNLSEEELSILRRKL